MLRTKHIIYTLAVALTAGVLLSLYAPTNARAAEGAFSYKEYAQVLGAYVDGRGLVDYRGLKARRRLLDLFTARLAGLDPAAYARWSDPEKTALWINAYNAFTLTAIIDHYPIKPSLLGRLRFPNNSIRQISGVWDKLAWPVMGRDLTLDAIEHEVLRREFNEPRIHMAIVCASIGCPFLRNEPFTGERLDEQLEDQARRFFSASRNFYIDRAKGRVGLSSIFKWFGGDFTALYGTNGTDATGGRLAGRDETERAVLNFAARYLNDDEREYLHGAKYAIAYLDYDWSLNEQP